MSADPSPEHIAIANLAVQMLPKIDLPSNWETAIPQDLERELSKATTGVDPNAMTTFVRRQGWATPFEVLAEEAVKRARLVMDAAQGLKRQARIDFEHEQSDTAKRQAEDDAIMQANSRKTEEEEEVKRRPFRIAFEAVRQERLSINEAEFLDLLFTGRKTKKSLRLKFLRAYQADTHGLMQRHKDNDGQWLYEPLTEFDDVQCVYATMGFWHWMETNRERLTKQWRRKGNLKGGQKATANLINQGEITGVSAKEKRNLDAAAKRADPPLPAKKKTALPKKA